jgi:hypothetical protein
MSETHDESTRNRNTAKRILAIGLPLVVIAATGIGYAYWTGTGSGSGSATAAGSVTAVTLAPTSAISGLVPGGSTTVPVTATNNNATTSVSIATLVAGAVSSPDGPCNTVLGTATAGATASATSPGSAVIVPPAGGTAPFGSVTITWANSATVNQDACKGKAISVALTAS